jgi:hypothetical protein
MWKQSPAGFSEKAKTSGAFIQLGLSYHYSFFTPMQRA